MIRKLALIAGLALLPSIAFAQGPLVKSSSAAVSSLSVSDGFSHTLLTLQVSSTQPGWVILTNTGVEPTTGVNPLPILCMATGPVPSGGFGTSLSLANLPIAAIMPNITVSYSKAADCYSYTPAATGTFISIGYQ